MITSIYVDGVQIHKTANHAVKSVRGLGTPAPRRDVVTRPRAHGAIDSTRYYDGRVLDLAGRTHAATVLACGQALDVLKGLFALDGGAMVFTFTREGFGFSEFVTARAASALEYELAGSRRLVEWAVQLHAADPRIYKTAATNGNFAPAAPGDTGGLVFPIVFPLSFIGGSGVGDLAVVNDGNFPTAPVFTIHGPATNPVIVNDDTGEAIYTTGVALAAGETLVIDVARRSCKLLGTIERPDLIDAAQTVWWEIPPTVTTHIRMAGSGFLVGTSSVDVSFHAARV